MCQDDGPCCGADEFHLRDQGIAQLDGIYTNGGDQHIALRDSTITIGHREPCRSYTTVTCE
jgi:hypothetical protein